MKLVNLQIKNFKCILDSTDFSVDQLTCLVGKNESGKSAILQALYKLNPVDDNAKYNALYDYPKAIPHRKKEPNTAKCDIINL